MAIISPKTAADRFLHALTGCVPDLCGNVTLEPSNYIPNWRLADLNDDNDAEGFTLGRPEDPDGFYIYMSQNGGGPSTLAAQNTTPISLEEDTYYLKEDWVAGHSPRDARFAVRVAGPDSPTLETRSSSTDGFAAGTYRVAYTWINGDKHTALSPTVEVTVGLGQYIRVFLPADVPDGADYVGLWLSSPNGGRATLRFQHLIWAAWDLPESFLMRGPYRTKKVTTTRNETYVTTPKAPTIVRVKRDGGISRAGTYKARLTRVDPRTHKESGPSEYSNEITLTQEEADKGIGIGLDAPIIGSYYVYFTIDDVEYRLNTDSSGGASGSKRPHNSGRRGSSRRRRARATCVDDLHITTGHTTAERLSSELPKRDDLTPASPPGAQATSRTVAVGGLSGENDTAAYDASVTVEDPTSPLDSVVAEGALRIAPGDYWVAISYSVRGEETLASPPVQMSIGSGEVGLIKLPDSNNLLTNAQWADRDANGLPDTWNFRGIEGGSSGGDVYYAIDDSLVLDTAGTKTGTTETPFIWQEIFINRSQFYAFGGRLSTALASGSADVYLTEWNSSDQIVRVTNIARYSTSGSYMSFNQVFGPGYTEFHDDTAYVSLAIQFGGSTRNGRIFLHELYANPGSSGRVRRTTSPLPQARQFTNSTPPTHTRWNKESIVGVMVPPEVAGTGLTIPVLSQLDFESGSLAGWVLRQSSSSGLTAAIEPAAAISGSYGYHLAKDTSSTRYQYLKAFASLSNAHLAMNFKVRVEAMPDRGILFIGSIKSFVDNGIKHTEGAGATGATGNLIHVALSSNGEVYLVRQSTTSSANRYTKAASGVYEGDVLDIELMLLDAGTSHASAYLSLGKNGARRELIAQVEDINFAGYYAHWALAGSVQMTDPAVRYTLHYDDITLTHTGNTLLEFPTGPSTLIPYERADRPYQDPAILQDASFDTGSLPSPFTSSRAPNDSTTAIAVETGAKIDGTHGVRVADTGTASAASAYIERPFSPTRTGVGVRARIRVVIRPGAGSINLMSLHSSGGQLLGTFTLDNLGNLTATTYNSSAAQHATTLVATDVTNGTILTLEMVASRALTTSGTLSYLVSIGGSGAGAERNLMAQHTLIPWSTYQIASARLGIVSSTSAASTATLNLDSVRITEAGEVVLAEYDEAGAPIYQAYFYYPVGTPQRDDLGLRDFSAAVQPNETYTFAIQARHRDVPATNVPARPYSLYAYDTAGEEFPLGSVYGEGGAVGTLAWQPLSLTFTVPDDCYLIEMRSPGISSGEFVCQRPALSRGTSATHEILYPDSGEVWAILDTLTPESFAFAPEDANPLENRWLDIGLVIDTPTGTSFAAQYNSDSPTYDSLGAEVSTGTEMPTSWLTDPLAVTPRRYAHFLIQLTASSDLKKTPTLRTHTPYVDLYQNLSGQQVSVLLRDDLSEFSGGVHILSDIGFFTSESEFDVKQPLGKVRRNRMWEPVGQLGPFTLRAYTRAAVRDIQENALSLDFCVETRDYRLIVRFRDKVTFGGFTDTRKVRGVWCTLAEASVDGAEVVEAIPINDLAGALVAP